MQKIEILSEDYERYNFALPLGKSFGNKRKRFIISELEQRHPCYSNDFCFDDLMRITGKGIYTDVVVMKKLKLMEYQKKNNRWQLGFFVENCRLPRFVQKKRKIWCTGVLLFGAFFFLFVLSHMTERKDEKSLLETVEMDGKEIVQEDEGESNFPNASEFGEKVFEVIQNNHGKLEKLEWSIDGFEEKIKASVSCLYPEQIEALGEICEISKVSYREGNAVFNFSARKKIGLSKEEKIECGENYQRQIRDFFRNKGIGLLEERNNPFGLKVVTGKNFEVFKEFELLLEKNNLAAADIFLSNDEVNGLTVDVSVSDELGFGNGLKVGVISEYGKLFSGESNREKKKEQNKLSAFKAAPDLGLTKIGEVKYTDGNKLVFYKDKAGKLVKRLERE